MASTAAAYGRPSYLPLLTQQHRALSSYHGCHASVENGLAVDAR